VELWAIWLIVAGLLLILEMLTLTFYLLWIGIGALAAALVAYLAPESFPLQAAVGCVVALALTFLTKRLVSRLRSSRGFRDAIDDLVGKQGVVVEDVGPGKPGIVKVGTDLWSATASETLHQGEHVVVVQRGNAVLEVRKSGG